ncbi:hypothetical protein Tco_0532919 [Tanacetum coccineum]
MHPCLSCSSSTLGLIQRKGLHLHLCLFSFSSMNTLYHKFRRDSCRDPAALYVDFGCEDLLARTACSSDSITMLLITRGAKLMNSSLVAHSLESRCSSTRAVTAVLRGSFLLSSATSFFNVVTLLLNWKTDAKFRSVDRGFIASVVGGGVGVDCYGGGVKDGNDCGMTVVSIREMISASVWGIFEKFRNLNAKSDE